MSTVAPVPPVKIVRPTIAMGPCLFMSAPGEPATIAMVTRAGSIVSLIAFPPESRVGIPFDTVRHVSDPDLAKYAAQNLGCWDYTDDQKALRALTKPSA